MLLQLEETQQEDVSKLFAYAKANHLKLSLVNEDENNYILPGKALNTQQLENLINQSREKRNDFNERCACNNQ